MGLFFQPSFEDLSAPLFDVTFCVLDLETTGGSAQICEITEIGAVKVRGGETIGSFQTLVDPGVPIPPSITFLTGITSSMVVGAPRVGSVLPSFLEFLDGSVIVGHNVRFDLAFLNAAASRYGYDRLRNKWVDTASLARRLVRPEVRNLRLQTLAAYFRSPVTPVHRALDDARATSHVFHALLERAGTIGVTNLDDLLRLPTARGSPHYSKIRLTENLPRRPGVYVFKDRDGHPIYVGKATDLRARVRQYFYGDERRSVAYLMRELHEIDHHVCTTVLEAEVTEMRLIHAYRPRYNRRLRPQRTSQFVKVTDEEFPRLGVVRTLKPDGLAYLGPFRSKRAAEEVMTAIWDAVPIRRCRSPRGSRGGPCAAAQLGVAACPCDGRLSPADYSPIVERLLAGLSCSPHLLLDPLAERMRRLAEEQRYEEAALARDRHDALARALVQRRSWQALVGAGLFEIEVEASERVVIDHGVFAGNAADLPDLDYRPEPGPEAVPEVPGSVAAAEEAAIIWRWLNQGGVRLMDATGGLALPAGRVEQLRGQGFSAA